MATITVCDRCGQRPVVADMNIMYAKGPEYGPSYDLCKVCAQFIERCMELGPGPELGGEALEHIPWLCPECGKVTNPGYKVECELCHAPRPS